MEAPGDGPERDLSNVSKESTMSFKMEKTSSSLDENVFEDAKRALAPSGSGQKQFIAPDGSVRHMSPHMVNVHQFYPEIAFSTDKGVVGEVVDVPKSASRGGKKSSLKIDPQATIMEDANEDRVTPEAATAEAEAESAEEEQKAARRGKVVAHTPDLTSDDESYHSDKEVYQELFHTEVDEGTIEAAKARKGGDLFYPEAWGPARTQTWTVDEIVFKRACEHAERAQKLFEETQFEDSLIAMTKAINLRPNIVDFYKLRGEAALMMCDFQSAILNYKKTCVLEPDTHEHYNRLAFIYYLHGQCLFDQKLYPEALESFSRAAEMRPEVIGYHMRSIACLAALQRHGECLALVNKRLEADSENPDLYVMRARLHQLFRNVTLCYYDIKDALALQEGHEQANKLMEELKHKAEDFKQQSTNMSLTGRFRDAMQKISIAIETNPSVAEYHNIRGAAHRKLGDFNAAIDDFLLALDKTDHNEEDAVYFDAQKQLLLTYNDFAVECFSKGFYEEAIILLNKAIKGEKGELNLYVNRGDCFFKENNLEFAMADYSQALELDPTSATARKRKAIVFNEYGVQEYLAKRNKAAEARFTSAIECDPLNARYYISRARTRHMIENVERTGLNFHGARQDVLLAVHLEPSHPEVSALLQRFFHGKSTKDVLASQAASGARKQLLQIAGPTLRPLTQQRPQTENSEPREYEKSEVSSTLAGASVSRENTLDSKASEPLPPILSGAFGTTPPSRETDWKSCMNDEEFAIKILSEKNKISKKIRKTVNDRGSLLDKGPKLCALPDDDELKKKVRGYKTSPPTKKLTGWRQFSVGIS